MPVFVNVQTFEGRLVKSVSDPCNLSMSQEEDTFDDCRFEYSDTDSTVRLKQNMKQRKRLLHSAKMKFLGMQDHVVNSSVSPGSRVRALISEIRDKINEVMSPGVEVPAVSRSMHSKMLCNEIRKIDCEEFSKEGEGLAEDTSREISVVRYQQPEEEMESQIVKPLLVEDSDQVEALNNELVFTTENDTESCSYADSTETEWYYEKTILMPHNTETVLEVGNQDRNVMKQSETGTETESPSEKGEMEYSKALEALETMSSNKTSETDSSFQKTSSGRTSIDIDTSLAFKTEESEEESVERKKAVKLPGIPESPEITSIDTEDAPITSSSKDSSPEIVGDCRKQIGECNNNETYEKSGKKKRKKSKKTRITVKKEVKKESEEPIKSEIKLTIKNRNSFTTESYEFEIQDDTNTSGEVSRSSQGEPFEVSAGELPKQCDCPAQQDLQMLKSEVTTSIVKLKNIEQYFEDEIKTMNTGEEDDALTCSNIEPEFPASNGSVPFNPSAILSESELPEVSCNMEIASEEYPLDKPKSNTINDVTDFIVCDEESPTESTADISMASEELSSDANKKPNRTFNILIATPDRKEIFINYDEKASSSFVSDEDMKCNSYINTDDVNEDFNDSPEWFSAAHGVLLLNTLPEAADSCSCSNYSQSPVGNSLAIIEEVEETEYGSGP